MTENKPEYQAGAQGAGAVPCPGCGWAPGLSGGLMCSDCLEKYMAMPVPITSKCVICEMCEGTGREPDRTRCPRCNGAGKLEIFTLEQEHNER
jgi:DnaJ-class molecular chaperone